MNHFLLLVHVSFAFCRHSPPLVLRFYDGDIVTLPRRRILIGNCALTEEGQDIFLTFAT